MPADEDAYLVHPIGVVRSLLRTPADAPNQVFECAPEAVLEIDPAFADALHRVQPGRRADLAHLAASGRARRAADPPDR